MPTDLLTQLASMNGIPLQEVKAIKLMNRVDTKYVANINLLQPFLELAKQSYAVQEIDTSRLATYDTMYYDTSSLEMYLKHHNRKLNRQKIRIRTYIDSDVSFLEIKNKTNKGRTIKKRIGINPQSENFENSERLQEFLKKKSPYAASDLHPQIRTFFNRITLVNQECTERLTIDINLRFENQTTHENANLSHLMIIELKQNSLFLSQTKSILHTMRIKPTKISKYCIGTALTNEHVKRNRFKRKIRLINKIQNSN